MSFGQNYKLLSREKRDGPNNSSLRLTAIKAQQPRRMPPTSHDTRQGTTIQRCLVTARRASLGIASCRTRLTPPITSLTCVAGLRNQGGPSSPYLQQCACQTSKTMRASERRKRLENHPRARKGPKSPRIPERGGGAVHTQDRQGTAAFSRDSGSPGRSTGTTSVAAAERVYETRKTHNPEWKRVASVRTPLLPCVVPGKALEPGRVPPLPRRVVVALLDQDAQVVSEEVPLRLRGGVKLRVSERHTTETVTTNAAAASTIHSANNNINDDEDTKKAKARRVSAGGEGVNPRVLR